MNCQQINYKYPLPKNFDSNLAEFDVFKNFSVENFHKIEVRSLKNIRISNNSILFRYFNIIEETCIKTENFKKYQKGYKFFLKFIFPKLNFSKKRFLLITDEWTSNYYHWHCFALKKLAILQENNLLENSILFLPKRYLRYKFVLQSLEKFGIKRNQIKTLRRKSNIKTKETCFVPSSQHHPEALKKVRETLLKNTTYKNLGFGNKIYISRYKQPARFLENEKEALILLEKYGFKRVFAEDFFYDDQINIARDAKYIVGTHGAGLTNLIFATDNASILELATKPSPQKPTTEYYKLSALIDINYYYQECQSNGMKNFDYSDVTMVADLKKLEENLKLMLAND